MSVSITVPDIETSGFTIAYEIAGSNGVAVTGESVKIVVAKEIREGQLIPAGMLTPLRRFWPER